MGKLKNIFKTLREVLISPDDITPKELATNEKIEIILKSSNLSEDEKKELTESVTKFDSNYIFRTSELKIKNSLAEQEKTKQVKLNSMKDIANVKEEIEGIDR